MNINDCIAAARRSGASDIHLVCGLPPRCRVDGTLRDMEGAPLTAADCLEAARALAGEDFPRLEEAGEVDLAATLSGVRCRLNLFRQQGCYSAAIRLLRDRIPALEELGLPPAVPGFLDLGRGLVLITGETGSGKSTTLAALLQRLNETRPLHLLTLEDPVEYRYPAGRCVINQREVGRDTMNFAAGLRAALREDPDVILVGELRDLDTIETALTAAETGHLVFATVHTQSAADSVDRIVDVFPAGRQHQIRLQLSMTLRAVLSQRLLPRQDGPGRVLCCEVMQVDNAIRNLIREGKTPQIRNAIQTSGAMGNILMERAVQDLFQSGVISRQTMDRALQSSPDARTGPGLRGGI